MADTSAGIPAGTSSRLGPLLAGGWVMTVLPHVQIRWLGHRRAVPGLHGPASPLAPSAADRGPVGRHQLAIAAIALGQAIGARRLDLPDLGSGARPHYRSGLGQVLQLAQCDELDEEVAEGGRLDRPGDD